MALVGIASNELHFVRKYPLTWAFTSGHGGVGFPQALEQGSDSRTIVVLPAAWRANVSFRSSLVPTNDPTTLIPFRTVSKVGSRMTLSLGSPTRTSVPLPFRLANACSQATGDAAQAIAQLAPPRARIASTAS